MKINYGDLVKVINPKFKNFNKVGWAYKVTDSERYMVIEPTEISRGGSYYGGYTFADNEKGFSTHHYNKKDLIKVRCTFQEYCSLVEIN